MSYWQKNRQVDQWKRIENLETDPYTYSQLTFDKGAKAIQWSEDIVFNKWCWKNWISTLDTDLTKINSKWITDIYIKCKAIKVLQDNIGENPNDLWYGDAFLDTTPKT